MSNSFLFSLLFPCFCGMTALVIMAVLFGYEKLDSRHTQGDDYGICCNNQVAKALTLGCCHATRVLILLYLNAVHCFSIRVYSWEVVRQKISGSEMIPLFPVHSIDVIAHFLSFHIASYYHGLSFELYAWKMGWGRQRAAKEIHSVRFFFVSMYSYDSLRACTFSCASFITTHATLLSFFHFITCWQLYGLRSFFLKKYSHS